MRAVRLWASLILVLAIVVAGAWAFWNFDYRWRPKTINRHQQEIAALLQASGWVAPGSPGKKLYLISTQAGVDGRRFRDEEFPKLQAKGVDTRAILVAAPDVNGQAKSSPTERATVAQLWITRDWSLLQRWDAAEPGTWKATGIPGADGDLARMAVVEGGRSLVSRLTPLLKDNGIRFGDPVLIWWNDKGEMRGCACERPPSYRFVRAELAG